MVKRFKNATFCACWTKRPEGLGIMLDFDPLQCGRKRTFGAEIKLVFFKTWIAFYKKD